MKRTLLIAAFASTLLAGCSLSRAGKSSSPANSAAPGSPTAPSSTPAITANEPDGHADATGGTATAINDELHTPAKGSDERQAIMDALRGNQQVIFQVNYLKVHNGWCWVDTTPLDQGGRATAEGGPNLLHFENGRWKVMNLAKVPEDPNDPLGSQDASPAYVRNVMKVFPGVPRDIFPPASK